MFKNPTQALSRTERNSQVFKTESINIALVVFLVVAIALGINPTKTSAASGTYYGGGSSGTYNGGGSSGTYYGGQSGTYYGGSSNPSTYSSSPSSYYSATPISSYSYRPSYTAPSYSSYSAPAYTYTPQPTYSYVPVGGGSSAPQSQYVYSSNTNANSNTNNNTITNTFNPTNNNDARINLIVYGGGETAPAQEQTYQNYQTYTQTYTQPNYAYDTSYTNMYSYPPAPTYVSYASNAQSQNQNNLGTPVSGVFLSQVPATGIGFGFKMTLFSVGLVLWSLFAAYMISRKKNGALANKIHAFKLANMQKKGIHN